MEQRLGSRAEREKGRTNRRGRGRRGDQRASREEGRRDIADMKQLRKKRPKETQYKEERRDGNEMCKSRYRKGEKGKGIESLYVRGRVLVATKHTDRVIRRRV